MPLGRVIGKEQIVFASVPERSKANPISSIYQGNRPIQELLEAVRVFNAVFLEQR